MPHFHIPLQSGSDKILALMKRRYNLDLFSRRIKKVRSLIPDCCIGVDVMVGFPGESESDFLETFNYLNELPVSYLHVFTYSERQNTKATTYNNIVPIELRAKRSKILRILSEKKRNHFYRKYLGSMRPVLFESIKNGFATGHTDNYLKVKLDQHSKIVNTIKNVNLIEIQNSEILSTLD